jgi:hypothetical protein
MKAFVSPLLDMKSLKGQGRKRPDRRLTLIAIRSVEAKAVTPIGYF